MRVNALAYLVVVGVVLAVGAAPPAAAQRAQFGVIGGAISLPSGLDQTGVAAVLQLQPVSWLTLGAHPAWVHVSGSDAAGSFSSSGLTDLPLEASIWRDLPGPLSPGLGLSLGVTLPTGDTAQGLGTGETSVGASLGGSLSPIDKWSFGADLWRPLSGAGWNTALTSSQSTSLSLETSYEISERTAVHAGFSTDLGGSDSTGVVRSLTAGFTLPLAGPVSLAVDGARGLTSGSPHWGFTVGIGSAFEGINPVGPNSPVRRLATAFGRGVNRGRGLGHVGGNGTLHGRK